LRSLQTVKQDLIRVARNAVIALLLIPGLTFLFTQHVQKTWDQDFIDSTRVQLQREAPDQALRNAAIMQMLEATPPSAVCSSSNPEHAAYRADVCEAFGDVWQVHWMDKTALFALIASAALLLLIAALGKMAFGDRDAQHRSMVLAWRLLAISGALIVVLQSTMVVWLSFWLTAFFFQKYIIKLIVVIGIIGVVAAAAAVNEIFAKIPLGMAIPGEEIGEQDAPALWSRIRALAAQMGTAPPNHIVGGIDTNFFVTEGTATVAGRELSGRILYVSLPLLRVLDQREADAVLAHELAHFKGGDTHRGAALGPKIAQFDTYCAAMHGAGLTIVAYFLLILYRTIFELSMMRSSREREFIADRAAAEHVDGLPLIRALIKVAAYSSYRNRIEQELFERTERHEGTIGIADYVAHGLQPFAHSEEFLTLMEYANVPHPYDSHPKLRERMDNVQCAIAENDYGQVLSDAVEQSWASEILTGAAIEARQWNEYESHFAQAHDQTLAYRYLPANDEERAIVEAHFPPVSFALDLGRSLEVRYDGLALPDKRYLNWDDVSAINYSDNYGDDVLVLTLRETDTTTAGTSKVGLPNIKPQREQLKAVLGQYWYRHKVARNQA
jgi:Zn-dependent protease with chaperone function